LIEEEARGALECNRWLEIQRIHAEVLGEERKTKEPLDNGGGDAWKSGCKTYTSIPAGPAQNRRSEDARP